MTLAERVHAMDKYLKAGLISLALLLPPQIGQFMAIRDLNTLGRIDNLALFFEFTALAAIPTSLILTGAVLWVLRKTWREHEKTYILGILNIIISLNLVWFLVAPCSWSQVFGVALKTCA